MSAQPEPQDLYPLATPEGRYIPLDVVRPFGVVRIVTDGTVYTIAELPTYDVLLMYSETNAWARFDGVAATPPLAGSFVTQRLFIPSYSQLGRVLAFDVRDLQIGGAPWDGSISAINVLGSAQGDIYIEAVVRYQALRSAIRVQRG